MRQVTASSRTSTTAAAAVTVERVLADCRRLSGGEERGALLYHVHPLMFCQRNMFSQGVFGKKVRERDESSWMGSRRDSAERASHARSVTVMRRVRFRSRDCPAVFEACLGQAAMARRRLKRVRLGVLQLHSLLSGDASVVSCLLQGQVRPPGTPVSATFRRESCTREPCPSRCAL